MFGIDFASIAKGFGEGILAPIASIFNKKEDVKLEQYRVDGQVNIAALSAEIEARRIDAEWRWRVSSELWVKRGRTVLVGYTLSYLGLVFYDSMFRDVLPDWATWRVLALPEHLRYVPHLTVALLIGEGAYNRFSGKK